MIDESFIQELPQNVDPCGENGEFHSFVFDGPCFNKPIDFTVSEEMTITKDIYTNEERFYYKDLNPIT